jgi:hypothetical protein
MLIKILIADGASEKNLSKMSCSVWLAKRSHILVGSSGFFNISVIIYKWKMYLLFDYLPTKYKIIYLQHWRNPCSSSDHANLFEIVINGWLFLVFFWSNSIISISLICYMPIWSSEIQCVAQKLAVKIILIILLFKGPISRLSMCWDIFPPSGNLNKNSRHQILKRIFLK